MFSSNKNSNSFSSSQKRDDSKDQYKTEKAALFAALFLFAFGMGLIMDGKKLHSQQVKVSQRVDFRATLNPYQ
jgi:hypothetical protein